jgi:hypothetical protein
VTRARLEEFRAQCTDVRNFPLARLCSDAMTGDERARFRVSAILAGLPDPGPDQF